MRKLIFSLLALLGISLSAGAQQSGFNLIVVGDTQPQTEAQFTELERDIMPGIAAIVEEYKATSELPTAILLTGDIVWDTLDLLPRVKALFEALDVPIYAVIGNHDHDRKLAKNERLAEAEFINIFGSTHYAFTLGETLFVALDNIDYHNYEDYSLDVSRKQRRWLKSIIADVPMDKRIAVAMHASAFDYRNDKKPYNYTDKLLRILDGRRVNFITGHRHRHATTEFNDKVIEHNVAQVNGNLWFAPICSDGTPRSVFCIEERDGEWQWHYRTLGQEANKQLVVWDEGTVKDNEEYIVVKVVGWDDKWRVEWFEDGHSRGAMEQISIFDPDYAYYVENIANYNETVMARLRRSAEIYNHYYRCRRTSPNSEITIVATDRFGREFREVIRPTE